MSDDPRGVHSIILGGNEITFVLEESICSRGALLRACYWFTDRCYIFISRKNERSFSVQLRLKEPSSFRLDEIAGEFTNALLDFELRAQIEKQTSSVRELIVAKAFAEGNLLDVAPLGDDRDPVEQLQTRRHRESGQDGGE